MSVYKKLQQARVKLQNTKLEKSGHNKFAGYKYFELGDFLPAVQSIFNELGLCGIVSYQADIATLRIIDTDDSSEIVITSPMGSAALKGVHEVQNIGAVETYQRRYLWVTAMEIVEHDALDATSANDNDKPAKAHGTITPTTGAFDALEDRKKKQAAKIAAAIESKFAAGEEWGAFEIWETEQDNDFKVAVWSLLGSKVRSTIKNMKAEADKPVTA